jgi:hypothetical protein
MAQRGPQVPLWDPAFSSSASHRGSASFPGSDDPLRSRRQGAREPPSRSPTRGRMTLWMPPRPGKCQVGRPTLSPHKPRNERFQAESDETHVPPQNAISTVLIIKVGHFSPLVTGGKSHKRAGDSTGREYVVSEGEPSWASLLLRDDLYTLPLLFLLFFLDNGLSRRPSRACLAYFLHQRRTTA